MKPIPSRRHWMAHALGLAGNTLALACAPAGAASADATTAFTSDPFTLGVASGWPTEQGAVIWTRLAPQPMQDNAGLDPVALTVRWELTEEGGTSPVQSGAVEALPQWAHSVRVAKWTSAHFVVVVLRQMVALLNLNNMVVTA